MNADRPSRIDRRWAVAVAAIACVAIGVGVSAWVFAPRDAAAGLNGPRMAISLVPPREPDVQPGSVLEVGALSDGFDRAVLERSAQPVDDPTWLPPEAYVGPGSPAQTPALMPAPKPVAAPAILATHRIDPTAKPDPLEDGSRLFGFDRPAPDLSAERARRMAALAEAERAAGLPERSSSSPNEYSSE